MKPLQEYTESELREMARKTDNDRANWNQWDLLMLRAFFQNRPYLLPQEKAAFHD